MSIYLSGKLTSGGDYKKNCEVFNKAEELIKAINPTVQVFNPAKEIPKSWDRKHAMRKCLSRLIGGGGQMSRIRKLVLLPGWEDSQGARIEYEVAKQLDIEIERLK